MASKPYIAVVIDEFRRCTVGIVTNSGGYPGGAGGGEICGRMTKSSSPSEVFSGKEYLVMGSAMRDKLFETLGVDEETEAVSVNGWIMNSLPQKYQKGDSFQSRLEGNRNRNGRDGENRAYGPHGL